MIGAFHRDFRSSFLHCLETLFSSTLPKIQATRSKIVVRCNHKLSKLASISESNRSKEYRAKLRRSPTTSRRIARGCGYASGLVTVRSPKLNLGSGAEG